jgi:uncharacterized membrane protein YraQ (UPF0718 family)
MMFDYIATVVQDVIGTVGRVWPFLLASVVAAAAVSVYLGADRVSGLLRRRAVVATAGAVALATLTPFCSCGTTAILIGMLASASPWAPLVAFMVASPLTSPSELVLSVGLFGWRFALVFFVGTIALGFFAAAVSHVLDRAGWLDGQARVQPEPERRSAVPVSIGPGAASVAELPTRRERWRLHELAREFWQNTKKLSLFFLGFTAVGYAVIEAIPTDWVTSYLGAESWLSVPFAAVVGVPAYINTEASLPLVASLMDGGMGAGPAMAFLVTGAGTSIGAITGLFVIARRRVVGLVVALLFVGAIGLGWIAEIVV